MRLVKVIPILIALTMFGCDQEHSRAQVMACHASVAIEEQGGYRAILVPQRFSIEKAMYRRIYKDLNGTEPADALVASFIPCSEMP